MPNPTRKPLPPVEVLEEWFSYDEETGDLCWKKHAQGHKGWEGKPAGSPNQKGYWRVKLSGTLYCCHRIAFKLVTGLEPPFELDHRDGNPQNNRLSNLRVPEEGDNQASAKLRDDNSSGQTGVSWCAQNGLWVSRVQRRRVKCQATFETREEAIAWRLQQEIELHGEFAQHRRNGVPENLPEGVTTRTTRRDNTSGINGVSWHKTRKIWCAYTRIEGRQISKSFPTKEEAITQRQAWEAEFQTNKPESNS